MEFFAQKEIKDLAPEFDFVLLTVKGIKVKTEQGLLEYLAWNHGALSLCCSHARASAACSPSGASSR